MIQHENWQNYRIADKLAMVLGVEVDDLVKLAVKEVVDNSLDSSGSCKIEINSNGIAIKDLGEGIEGDDSFVARLFSMSRPDLTSKAARKISRGALGIGLRVLAGVIFTTGSQLFVSTNGRTLKLCPLFQGETTHEYIGSYNHKGTNIEMIFEPRVYENNFKKTLIEDRADYWGSLAIDMARGTAYTGNTLPLWYDSAELWDLLDRAGTTSNVFIADILKTIFGQDIVEEVISPDNRLRKCNVKTLESEQQVAEILELLRKSSSKSIDGASLGCVGELNGFEFYKTMASSYEAGTSALIKAEVPYFIEAWGKRSKYSNIEFFVNKSPVPKRFPCYYGDGKIKIIDDFLYDGGYSLAMPLDLRVNIMAPYVPKHTQAKEPDFSFFADAIKKVLQGVFDLANKQFKRMKELERTTIRNNILPEVIPEAPLSPVIDIKAEAKRLGIAKKSLLVLAPSNDPFNSGSETNLKDAGWFSQIISQLGYGPANQAHLRRVHYKIASFANIARKDGTLYINTFACWEYLLRASKHARTLGFVDMDTIIDMRSPEPFDYSVVFDPDDIKVNYGPVEWPSPTISLLNEGVEFSLPSFNLTGYQYSNEAQPYHIEVWNEKSTMNDLILPLCKKYSLRYCQGIGYSSITSAWELIKKVKQINKPTIVLYISDFDPAGVGMPIATAREIEFFKKREKIIPNIMLTPIMLLKEQIEEYNLPITPLETKHSAADNFAAVHGNGSVELDALEALHPGVFSRIIEENILKYFDEDLRHEFESAEKDAHAIVDKYNDHLIASIGKEVGDIQEKVNRIAAAYNAELKKLQEKIEEDLVPYQEELTKYQKRIAEHIAMSSEITLPSLPHAQEPEITEELLFDSSRDYFAQLNFYSRFKFGKDWEGIPLKKKGRRK